MRAGRPSSLRRWSTASLRQALAATLQLTGTGMSALRRGSSRWLGRAELHVRAWREALDPETAEWATRARSTLANRDAEQVRRDLQARIEQARRPG